MRYETPFLTRLARDTAGNTLAIAAAAMIPFIILVGSGVDLGVTYMARGKLQNACDAGVLAARQSMEGTEFDDEVEAEAQRFFDFNFPDGTAGAFDREFEVVQDESDDSQLLGTASASIPTSLMRIAGVSELDIAVACDAKRDLGHNDIMLVLDVTGTMNCPPGVSGACGLVEQPGSKISEVREGAMALYRALESSDGSITRYGLMPYNMTVNVGRSLKNKDILRDQTYVSRVNWNSVTFKTVHINNSSWNMNPGNTGGNTQAFRTSGQGCIEERPSIGGSMSPFEIEDTVSRADIDTQAGNAGNQPELQFGRYDPRSHTNAGSFIYPNPDNPVLMWRIDGGSYNRNIQARCTVPEATLLQQYADEEAYETAVNAATARSSEGTYHDIGMLWALRFISRTGYFGNENPTQRDGIPVNQHIVFLTDGKTDTGLTSYSAYGIQALQRRLPGVNSKTALDEYHLSRYYSVCELAQAMGVTVWVIAVDTDAVEDIEAIAPCATSEEHFWTSDGTDLVEVFEEIGRGIGNLRLTR